MILENAAVSCRAAFLEGPAYLIYKSEKIRTKIHNTAGNKGLSLSACFVHLLTAFTQNTFYNFFIHTHTEAFYFSMLFPIIPKPERKRLQPPASLSFSTGYDFIDRMG